MKLKAGGRVTYRRKIGDCMYYVIAELRPDGELEFWWQESGEARWYPYSPVPAERDAALRLLREEPSGKAGAAWPLLL